MARAIYPYRCIWREREVDQGVTVVACTPHILPGLYHNSGPAIRQATQQLQGVLDQEGIPLQLVPGADVHMAPDFIAGLAVRPATLHC